MQRSPHPEVAHLRAKLGPLTRDGRTDEADAVRIRLAEAKRRADLLRIATDPPPITAQMFAVIVRRLGRVVVDD